MRIVKRILLAAAILSTSPAALSAAAPLCIVEPDSSPTVAAKSLAASPGAAAVLGATPTDIHARFAGVIEQNFRTGNPNKIVHALTSRELADLAALYKRAGGTTTLLELMAKHVDADGLTMVASAFGQAETAAAAKAYASGAVYTEFNSLPVRPLAQTSRTLARAVKSDSLVADGTTPAPTVDMTPTEIYLDFRTAPNGSLSVVGSLYEAGVFIGTRVAGAFGAGYAAGTVVNELIEVYDPELEDAIGGTVAGMLQQMQDAVNALAAGRLEQAVDDLFAVPIAYTNPGDFDVTVDMADLNGPPVCE